MRCGGDPYVDYYLSSVRSTGLCDKECEVLVHINRQIPGMAGIVHVARTRCKDEMYAGAGYQGIRFGDARGVTLLASL